MSFSKSIVTSLFILLCYTLNAQNVGIGTTSPDASAALEILSENGGFLGPRLTDSERDAIASPADGLLIFNTDIGAFQYFVNGAWTRFSDSDLGLIEIDTACINYQQSLQIDVQGNTPDDYYFASDYRYRVQSFIPNVSGYLSRIDFQIDYTKPPLEGEDYSIVIFESSDVNGLRPAGPGGSAPVLLDSTWVDLTNLTEYDYTHLLEDVYVEAGKSYVWGYAVEAGVTLDRAGIKTHFQTNSSNNGDAYPDGACTHSYTSDFYFQLYIDTCNAVTASFDKITIDSLYFPDGSIMVSNSIFGKYPLLEENSLAESPRVFTVGAGTSEDNRKSAITVLGNGKVGINTDDPDADLEVQNDEPEIRLTDGASDASDAWNTLGKITFNTRDKTNNNNTTQSTDPSHTIAKIEAVAEPGGVAPDGQLEFSTGKNDEGTTIRMVIDHDGDVGIGTREPTQLLHLEGEDGVDGILFPDSTFQTTAYPQTGILAVTSGSFHAYNSKETFKYTEPDVGTYLLSSFSPITAPVHLPHGATITKITWHYLDNHAQRGFKLRFMGENFTSDGKIYPQLTSSIKTTGHSTSIRTETLDVTPYNYTVDNATRGLSLWVNPYDDANGEDTSWSSQYSLAIFAVVFEYTH